MIKLLILDNFVDFFCLENCLQNISQNRFVFHLDFAVEIVRQDNFFNVANLSFDERFSEYYYCSLH